MTYIEVIRIRLSDSGIGEVKSKIRELAANLEHADMRVYQHATIKSDFAVHIRHRTSRPAVSESGQHLVAVLKEMGLVNHSIWVEFDSEKMIEMKDETRQGNGG